MEKEEKKKKEKVVIIETKIKKIIYAQHEDKEMEEDKK